VPLVAAFMRVLHLAVVVVGLRAGTSYCCPVLQLVVRVCVVSILI